MATSRAKRVQIRILTAIILLGLTVLTVISYISVSSVADMRVIYSKVYDAKDYDIPQPDTLELQTEDGLKIEVLEIRHPEAKGSIICLTGQVGPSVTAFYGHAEVLFEQGYSIYLPELRAHGNSEGEVIGFGFTEYMDVAAITNYIAEHSHGDDLPIIVIGHSMGGAVALNSMSKNDDIDGVVAMSTYSSVADMFVEQASHNMPSYIAEVASPIVQIICWIKYGENPWDLSPKNSIKNTHRRKVLLMHNNNDPEVSLINLSRNMQGAASYVEIFTREDSTHTVARDFLHPINDVEYSQRLIDFVNSVTTDHIAK